MTYEEALYIASVIVPVSFVAAVIFGVAGLPIEKEKPNIAALNRTLNCLSRMFLVVLVTTLMVSAILYNFDKVEGHRQSQELFMNSHNRNLSNHT